MNDFPCSFFSKAGRKRDNGRDSRQHVDSENDAENAPEDAAAIAPDLIADFWTAQLVKHSDRVETELESALRLRKRRLVVGLVTCQPNWVFLGKFEWDHPDVKLDRNLGILKVFALTFGLELKHIALRADFWLLDEGKLVHLLFLLVFLVFLAFALSLLFWVHACLKGFVEVLFLEGN